MSRVFVTGGTGVIGRALVTELVARGDEVVALARSGEAESALRADGCEVVRGEVFDVDAMARGMDGCALGYNLAGVNTLCVQDPAPMRRARVASSRLGDNNAAHAVADENCGRGTGGYHLAETSST